MSSAKPTIPSSVAIEVAKEEKVNSESADLEQDKTAAVKPSVAASEEEKEEDEEDEDILGWNYALVWLGILTVAIAFLSEALVRSIGNTAKNISGYFLAAIVLPIVGNAAEHASAVIFAMRGKLDLSLGVAIGSSTQIALMVLPLTVIIAWCANLPMSLNFQPFEGLTLILTVMIVTFAIMHGRYIFYKTYNLR